MPTLSYPGVYIQEIPGGTRPLEAATTSTAAFVGLAEMGPEAATRITSWTEFQRVYGAFIADSYLAPSVFQFFNNGGRLCYIVRVTRPDADTASVTVNNRAAAPVAGLLFSAKNKGGWGNSLLLQIEDGTLDPGNEYRVSVRRQSDPAAVPANFRDITPLEVFDNLSADPAAPNYAPTVLGRDSGLVDVKVLDANKSAAQRGLHRGGFVPNGALPLGANRSFQISLDNDGLQTVALPATAAALTALSDVATAIRTAVSALTPKKVSTPAAAFTGFTCTVETVDGQPRLLLQSGTTAATSSVRVQPAPATDATSQLKLGVGQGGRSEDGIAVRRPANADAVQVGDAAAVAPVAAVHAGTDGDPAVPLGVGAFKDAFPRLNGVTDVSLLAVPGEGSPALTGEGMAYCANRPLQDLFFLGDMASHDDTPDDATVFRNNIPVANSYGAVYFPWVRATDPSGRSVNPVLLPPSGYVAGLCARIDATRGVWKAPAGTEASLNGSVGLAVELSDVQHGTLNPIGVNVIRRFPGSGVVSFGARTVTSDAAWRYVPVRRTAIMLRVSIYNGIQFAVFEPNDEPLWSQLRLSIGAFMTTLFRQGAFQGSTPDQGFFVKCDGETTTQADIDAGVVNVLVGFAPLKPAEFVVVKISQKAGLASG
ncbi:phage tail sheath subtilisin-like domain-containing protein [Streptomyces sp. ODS28]|uniref:phage tail sheath family protein n=1 Tax=Streptomyces sp. ODS28 TaxID=3136688 RepID=UPI0031E7B327